MKRMYWVWGTLTVLLALTLPALSLTGCGGDGDHTPPPGPNLIGGTIESNDISDEDIRALLENDAVNFAVNRTLASSSSITFARAAVGSDPESVSGQLRYGTTIIDLEGFYDPESSNFTFSGAANRVAFEFFGFTTDEKAHGKLKIKKSDNEWKEEVVMFDFDSDVWVTGNSATSAPGLPAEWMGMWNCFKDSSGNFFAGNNQLSEEWRTLPSSYLIITPHSIGFWFDMKEMMQKHYDKVEEAEGNGLYTKDNQTPVTAEEYIEWWYTCYLQNLANFSLLEVTGNDDGSYDVLTMNLDGEWPNKADADYEYKYRKLRFMQGTGEYSDELWIIMCTFDGYAWNTRTETATEAREGTSFDYNRENWGMLAEHDPYYDGAEPNYNLFVAKR